MIPTAKSVVLHCMEHIMICLSKVLMFLYDKRCKIKIKVLGILYQEKNSFSFLKPVKEVEIATNF